MTSAPGCTTLWAQVVPVIAGEAGVSGVSVTPRINPQVSPGGSSFTPGVPSGWTQLKSGLWVPPSFKAKSFQSQAGGAAATPGLTPAPAAVVAEDEAAPAPVATVTQQEGFKQTLEALTPESVKQAPAEDSTGHAERLQQLVERQFKAPRAPADLVVHAEFSKISDKQAKALFTPYSPRLVSSIRANRVAPAPGSAEDRPDSIRAAVLEVGIWFKSFKHYFVDISIDNWRQYRAKRSASIQTNYEKTPFLGTVQEFAADKNGNLPVSDARGLFKELNDLDLPVSDARGFFGDTRMMGMVGGFKTIGSVSGNDVYVLGQAQRLFDRYFDHPLMTAEARKSFTSYLSRAALYNPARRSSNLRKHVRKALQNASVMKPDQIAAHFDSLFTDKVSQDVTEYQKSGQFETLAAFRAAVAAVVEQEAALEADPAKRVIGVIVLGSFASGVATPTSDFDLQVMTADGSSTRVKAFLDRLKARWTDAGHPVNPAPFGIPPSRGLLLRMHREPYLILSPDTALEKNLSPPLGTFADQTRPAQPTLRDNVEWRAYRGFLTAAIWFTDLKDRFGAAPDKANGRLDDKAWKKALTGLILYRLFSISVFIFTSVAYWTLATTVVGGGGYATLMSLGAIAPIALGSVSGLLADRMTIRNSMILNAVIRAGSGFAIYGLIHMGMVGFWPLLLLSFVNSWNITSIMISDDKLVTELAGDDANRDTRRSGLNALMKLEYFWLNVGLGIFLGVGKAVDLLTSHFGTMEGLGIAFLISGLVNFPLVAAIQWFTMPNTRPSSRQKPPKGEGEPAAPRPWYHTAAIWGGLLTVGGGVHLALKTWAGVNTALPLVLAMLGGLYFSSGFQKFKNGKSLLTIAGLGMLASFVFYPLQQFVIPLGSGDLHGGGLLKGQLLGALFFGQMLATSLKLDLPAKWKLAAEGAGLGAIGLWLYFYLFPHNLIALGAGMAIASVAYTLCASLTDKGWLKLYGVALASIWLPWANFTSHALLTSLLLIGLFTGPIQVILGSLMQKAAKEADPAKNGQLMGVNNSLNVAAVSLAYAMMGFITGKTGPAASFPSAFLPMGLVYIGAALAFWFLANKLGDRLPKSMFQPPAWLRRWMPWLAIKARIRENGVKVIVTDYDGTLMDKVDNKAIPASDELVKLLTELRRETGVRLVVSTNHFFDGDHNGMTHLIGDRLPADVRAGMMFVVQSGSVIYEYGPNGEKPTAPAWTEVPFDDAERAKITPAFEKAAAEVGLVPGDWKLFHEGWTLIEIHNKQERVPALHEALAKANKDAGWGYLVQTKGMPTMRGVPYIQFFKAHKGTGARKAFEMLKAQGAVEKEEQVMIFGDDFKPEGNDLYMAQSLPAATGISVGETADARQSNVYQWKTPGASSTHEILRELLKLLPRIYKGSN